MIVSRAERLRVDLPFASLGACLLASAALLARIGVPPWIPPAPMTLAGLPSPLTGMTRSFVALASADVGAAFGWHPLGPVAALACVAAIVSGIHTLALGERPKLVVALVSGTWFVPLVLVALVSAWLRQAIVVGA